MRSCPSVDRSHNLPRMSRRSSRPSRFCLASVRVRKHHVHPAPTPIQGVMLDQTLSVQFHRFHEIHLLAVRLLTGIFPDHLLSVREIARPIILTNTGFTPADFPQEWSHLLISLEHTQFGLVKCGISGLSKIASLA